MILWSSIPEGMVSCLSTSLGFILLWSAVLPPIVCLATAHPRTLSYRLHDNVAMDTIIGNVGLDANIFQGPESRSSTIVFQLYSPLFWIHAQDGILRTRSAIDRDALCPGKSDCSREVNVQVRQQTSLGSAVTFVKVILTFDDDNDNSPRFGQPEVRASLSEGSRVGTRLLLPKATDADSPRYGVQRYALENDPESVFSLEQMNDTGPMDAYLVLRSRLDRESVDQYRVHLVAFDGGQPSRSGVAVIVVDVKDINDNIPVFDRDIYEVEVSENVLPGTVISRVKATDQDSGMNGQIVYELDPASDEGLLDLFRIDGTTGEVIVQERLDYETHPIHTIIVLARDGGGPDAIPGQVRVVVRLRNYNDNPPDVWIQSPGESEGRLRMSELSSPGHFLSLVTVTDGDGGNTTIVCFLNDDHFRLEPLFKNEYKIVTAAEVDRETHAQLTLVVMCEDDGLPALTGSGNVTVIIEDGNDNRPIFLQDSYTIEVSEDHPLDQPILGVSAVDEDEGPNGEVRYAVESDGDGFSVDAKTGVVFATHPLDRERQQVVVLTLTAIDLGDPPLSSSASVSILVGDVDDELPRFSQASYTFTVSENDPPNSIVGQVHAVDADLPPFNTVRYVLLPEMTEALRVGSDDGVLYTTRELDREITDMERFQLHACSGSAPAANCSSVEVTIIVLDVNDNDPSVLYPLPWETIHIGNRFRVGDPVARIRASDPDSGDSGRVEFHVINQTTDDYFRVDENSGEILVVGRDLAVISHATFTLHVVVSDLGSPPRHALAVISLTVNETLSSVTTAADERQAMMMMSGKNLVVVIIIASASGLIVVLLVVAIACLVRSLAGRKVIRQRSTPAGGEVKSYLMRSDPGGRRETGSMKSTLEQLNPGGGGMTLASHSSIGKPHAVYYDRSIDDATIGHGSAFKWSAGDENDDEGDEEDEDDEMRMGSSRWKANNKHQQQQQRKRRRLSLTVAAPDASDSGRGSSEEVMHSRNQQQLPDGKLKCHPTTIAIDRTFIDLKSSDKSGQISNRISHPQQHTTDQQLPQQFMDANNERTFNRSEPRTDPCSEISHPHHHHHVTPSVHFRSPPIPLWNTKEDGSGRATKKSWTETDDLCCRSHPELLVDCNVFSSDNCGSFV